MEKLVLNIKDRSKLTFLMQLISQLDFVEVVQVKRRKTQADYDFFKSAGLWENRDIDAKKLRKTAWDRTK